LLGRLIRPQVRHARDLGKNFWSCIPAKFREIEALQDAYLSPATIQLPENATKFRAKSELDLK
jgi:hypothetical protein